MVKDVPSSFDIIGSKEKAVAIVEMQEQSEAKEKELAASIIQSHKNVKSVLKKLSDRKGEFRIREHKLIAGERNTEVLHKEYGYLLKLDPQKVYFSPRESTERQRVAEQVKAGETVMVMFSGVGPFALAIAKKQPEVKKIIAVEINPTAVDYMKYNIRVNKLSHKIVPIEGNVRTVCKNYYNECDRVLMPLPLGAENFLDIAIRCLKKSGIIHFYNWGEEGKLFENALEIIDKSLSLLNRKYKVLKKRKVLQYSPKKWKVCIEFRVE